METTQTFKITGMHCVACTKLTAKRFKTLAGVQDIAVDLDSGRATVVTNRTLALAEVKAALEGSGYYAEEDND